MFILLSVFVVAEEGFESFDDEKTTFVIKSKKTKIVVHQDATQEKGTVTFIEASMGSNEAMSMRVKNFLVFSKLKDINARYFVVNLELNNLLKSQKVIVANGSNHPSSWVNKRNDNYRYKEATPPYRIANIKQHLYLSLNNETQIEVNEMSKLLDKPLVPLNGHEIEVLPQQTKEGELAFRLPKDTTIKQLSLHYYDSRYGNINLPIVGKMEQKTLDVKSLPQRKSQKMNENFTLHVTGYNVVEKIGEHKAPKEGQFEIVEIDIESKLYALLTLNPAERFYLTIGDTHPIKLHPITEDLPMGLYSNASLSPGSNNKFRLAFYVPKGMEKQRRNLMMELQGEDIVLPIKEGVEDVSKRVLSKETLEGITVEVNGAYSYEKKIVIDVTFTDKKDDYATRLHNVFALNGVAPIKSDTLLSMKAKEVILNGHKKRVLLWFNHPSLKQEKALYLTSTLFKSFNFKIDTAPPALPQQLHYFLVKAYPYKAVQDNIENKVLAMVKNLKAEKLKEEKTSHKQVISTLETLKEKSQFTILPPLLSGAYGQEKMAKIKTVDDLIRALQRLEWVPSTYDFGSALYSPAAMFTQGWSSENEMFNAIYNQVKAYNVAFGTYNLSEEGKATLKKLAHNIPIKTTIPFIEWKEHGKQRSLVLPFLKPIDEVRHYIEKKVYLQTIQTQQATIEMTLSYTPQHDGTTSSGFGMFGGALGGATTIEKSATIFKKSWNIDEISDMPIDVFFPQTTGFYTDNNGTHQDETHALNEKEVQPKVLSITITMPDGKLDTYEHHFGKKQALKDVFFTFALGMPDLPVEASKFLEKRGKLLFEGKEASKISPMSRVQWMNRAKIYKFISTQTKYEKRLSQTLNIQSKRHKTSRAMMAIIEKKENQLISSLDLRRVKADVYGDDNASNAFTIMSGLMATEAERVSSPTIKKAINAFSIMKENQLLLIFNTKASKEAFIEEMKTVHLPQSITQRLMMSDKMWIFPTKRVKKRWAWMEIDPKNYQITTVLDNNQYGMVDYSVTVTSEQAAHYFVGLLAGVSVSVMTVEVYKVSLEEQDYQAMMKEAEEMAKRIGCGVSLVGGVVGKNGLGKKMFDSSVTIAGCAGVDGDVMRAVGSLNGKGKLSLQNALNVGFAQGFSDGIAYYFAIKNN